eukprot:g2460.t1
MAGGSGGGSGSGSGGGSGPGLFQGIVENQPKWLIDLWFALGFVSCAAAAYTVLLITQLERGLSKRGKAVRCTTLLIVRATCLADIGMHSRDLALQLGARTKVCWLSGFVAQAFSSAAVLFQFVIALDVLRSVRDPLGYRSDASRYIAVATAASAVLGVLAVVPGIADTGEAYCHTFWMRGKWMLLFYVPLWLIMLFCAGVLGYFVAKKYHAIRKGQTQKANTHQRLVSRMALFTVVFVLRWLPLSVVRGCYFSGRDVAACASTAAVYLIRPFKNGFGLSDMLVWYRPVCNHAARERVTISELAALRRLVGSCSTAGQHGETLGLSSSLDAELAAQEEGDEAAPRSSNPLDSLVSGENPGV